MIIYKTPDYHGNLNTKEVEGSFLVTKSHDGRTLAIQEIDLVKAGQKTKWGEVVKIDDSFVYFDTGKKTTKERINTKLIKSHIPKIATEDIEGTYLTPYGAKVNLENNTADIRTVITNPDSIVANRKEVILSKGQYSVFLSKKLSNAIVKSIEIIKKEEVEEEKIEEVVKIKADPKAKVNVFGKGLNLNFATNLFNKTPKVESEQKINTGVNWNQKGGEKPGHKYIQRKPNKTGDGYIYLYELPNGKKQWQDEDGKEVDEKDTDTGGTEKAFLDLNNFPKIEQGDFISYAGKTAEVLKTSDHFVAVNIEGKSEIINKWEYLDRTTNWNVYKEGEEISHNNEKKKIIQKADNVMIVEGKDGAKHVIERPQPIQKTEATQSVPLKPHYSETEKYNEFQKYSNTGGMGVVSDLVTVKYAKLGDTQHKIVWSYDPETELIDSTINGENLTVNYGGKEYNVMDVIDNGETYIVTEAETDEWKKLPVRLLSEVQEDETQIEEDGFRDYATTSPRYSRVLPETQDKEQNVKPKQDEEYSLFDDLFGDEPNNDNKQDEQESLLGNEEKPADEPKTWQEKLDFDPKEIDRKVAINRGDEQHITFHKKDGTKSEGVFSRQEENEITDYIHKMKMNEFINEKVVKRPSTQRTEQGTTEKPKSKRALAQEEKARKLEEDNRIKEENAKQKEEIQRKREKQLNSQEYKDWQKELSKHWGDEFKIQNNPFFATTEAEIDGMKFKFTRKFGESEVKVEGAFDTVDFRGKERKITNIKSNRFGNDSTVEQETKDRDTYIVMDGNELVSVHQLKEENGKNIFRSTKNRGLQSNKGIQKALIQQEPYNVIYEVIEAEDLRTSHIRSGGGFMKDPTYNLPQNRTYKESSDMAKVEKIATAPIFDLLSENPSVIDGAPTVTEDYQAVAGNGRGMGIKAGYEINDSYKYKDDLIKNAEKLGFNGEEISKMKKPVLVRKFVGVTNEEAAGLAGKTNTSNMAEQTPFEKASAKVNSMKPNIRNAVVERINGTIGNMIENGEKMSIDRLLRATVKNKGVDAPLAQAIGETLFSGGTISENEKTAFVNASGDYNPDALKDIVLNLALGSAAEHYSSLPKSTQENVNKISPYMITINHNGHKAVTESFTNAVKITAEYERTGTSGESFEDWLGRREVSFESPLKASKGDIAMADVMLKNGVNDMREKFNNYIVSSIEGGNFFTEQMEEGEAFEHYFVKDSEIASKFPDGINAKAEKSVFTKIFDFFRNLT